MVSVIEQEFQHGLCESGLAPPKQVEDGKLLDDDGKPSRTGTVWTACAHIITACVGAGVLSLAWAMSQLGWIAGIVVLLIFSSVSLYTSCLLADCYRSPHPVTGKRNYSYIESVKTILGGTKYYFCGWIQYGSLASGAVGYTITAAKSLVAIQKSNCHRKNGLQDKCKFPIYPHMIGFGILEIFLSQIPNFSKLTGLSIVAAIMSFGYTSIGIGLSIFKIVKEHRRGRTSIMGVEIGAELSASDKIWRMFAATGDIAFACTYAQILIDIQDTLKSSLEPENNVMKKASVISASTMTTIFTMCGCLGYVAFGDNAPENLLTGFGDQDAVWVVDLAHLFIVVHLVGAYQIFAQPVFRVVETWANKRWPISGFIKTDHEISIGKIKMDMNLFKMSWRIGFVAVASVIAMALPFFSDMLALLGALEYWPLVVYFPVEMHIAQNKIAKGTKRWMGLQLLSMTCLLISIACAAGALQGLNKGLHSFQPFKTKD